MTDNIVARSRGRYKTYEKRHVSILDTAIRLFNEKGYKSTTTADIAEEVGVSEPILYKHFENKKQLFIECFKVIIKELMSMYREARRGYQDDEVGYLMAVSKIYIHYVQDNPHKSRFLVHLLSYRDNHEFEVIFNRFIQASLKDIESVIDAAKQKDLIEKQLNSNLLAGMFVTQYFTVVALKELITVDNFREDNLIELTRRMLAIKGG